MPKKQRPVDYTRRPLAIEVWDVGKETPAPEIDYLGESLDTSNPLIWPRPKGLGKEHGG